MQETDIFNCINNIGFVFLNQNNEPVFTSIF